MTMTYDELLDFLDSDKNEYGLDSVATHGFLTASVVGKPMPNWLSLYFEGNDKQVPDNIKTALTDWRESLINTLSQEQPLDLPFESDEFEDFSEESDIVAWAVGFVDAMYADENVDWFDNPATEEEVAELTLPMIILSGIEDEDQELVAMRKNEDMLAELANTLEDNITELFLLFHTDDE